VSEETVVTFEDRGRVCVALVMIPEILHPEELDLVRQQLRSHIRTTEYRGYVLDLSGISYLTSAALGMLINTHAHLAAEGRRFAIVARAEMVLETLRHTHLEKIFPVATRVDDAVAAIDGDA
jgi:anti-anti-sigma factor